MKLTTFLLLIIFLGNGSNSLGTEFTATGVGGGGWLHSGAFHPIDPDVILVGTDFAGGIYRTDDFGLSWRPFNEGLQNNNEYDTNYVEDLLGISANSFTGFIAATYGGIYSMANGNPPWICETPIGEVSYTKIIGPSDYGDPENYISWSTSTVQLPVPFSCLTAVGDTIYAGAGRVRWGSTYENDYYPGLADPSGVLPDQFTVWSHDLGTQNWIKDQSSESLGAARDISAARINGQHYIVVATPYGIMLKKGSSSWEHLENRALRFGSNTYSDYYPESLTCWSVHLTSRGTLYVAMQMTGSGTEPVSGVYRIYDVDDPSNNWTWVGDGQSAGYHGTIEAAGVSGKNLIYLTVNEGDVGSAQPDTLYLGSRTQYYGLYRGEQPYNQEDPGSWQEVLYSINNGGGDISLYNSDNLQVDGGWISAHAHTLFHPAMSASFPNRLAVQFAGRMHVSGDGGETWDQRYTIANVFGWQTRGYNEMAMEDFAVDSEGRLYFSAGDEGLFRSLDDSWRFGWGDGSFENINPIVNTGALYSSNEIWNKESAKMEIMPNWMGLGDDAVVVHFGDMIQYSAPGKIMMKKGNESWVNITAGVDSLDHYLFPDFTFANDTTIFAAYIKYNTPIFDGGKLFETSGVIRFDYNSGSTQWDPTIVNDGLADSNNNNAHGSSIIYNEQTGKIFLGSSFVNYCDGPDSNDNRAVSPADTTIYGSLFFLQSDTAMTWQHALSSADSTYIRDVRCLAQSADGGILYVGTRGRSRAGYGTVLKCTNLDQDVPSCTWLANEVSDSFGWGNLGDGQLYTSVADIEVDPDDPNHIFAGLVAKGCATSEGVWEYDNGSWLHLSEGELFKGMGIRSLLISGLPKTLVIGTDGQGPYFKAMPYTTPVDPVIANAAEFPILANNVDATTSIAVEVTHPLGFEDLDVWVDATALGGSVQSAFDNGVFPDIEDGDDIYTTPLFNANVGTGHYYITVHALADPDNGGDGSFADNDSVLVEVIDSAVKMSGASDKTGDLYTQLSGNPYAENYFATPFAGSDELLLSVVKDDGFPPQVFRRKSFFNDGVPDFEEKTDAWFDAPLPTGTRAVIAAEVDGHTGKELFVCNNGASPRFCLNDSVSGQFVDATATYFDAAGLNAIKYSHTAAWGDYNEDGFIDLAVASLDQASSGFTLGEFDNNPAVVSHISLFRGTGTNFELTSHSTFPSDMTVLSMSWRDIDNDGDQDLVIFGFNQNSVNPVVMINNGIYDVIAEDYTLTLSGDWGTQRSVRSMAWTDFNHDLLPDLLVLTNDTPDNHIVLLENTGTGFSSFQDRSLSGVFETILVGDVQQNGQEDIAIFPSSGGPKLYFLDYFIDNDSISFDNTAQTVGLMATTLGEGDYASGGVIADFNDDHDLDVLVGRPDSLQFFYRNVRSNFDSKADYDATNQYNNDVPVVGEQNWLEVELTPVGNSNRSCIGAKVIVSEESGDMRQWMQVIDGGSGRGGQNPNQLHFGLGSYSGVVSVVVIWPLPGLTLSPVSGLAVNQVVQVPELADKSGGCIVINGRSVTFSHNPFPGGSDWVFEWKTDVKGDLTKDQVTWRYQVGQYVGQGCLGSYPTTLHWGDPEVEVTAYYRNGSWQHRLVWKNQICSTVPCPFEFEASSGYDGCFTTSNTVQFGNFGVCIGQ